MLANNSRFPITHSQACQRWDFSTFGITGDIGPPQFHVGGAWQWSSRTAMPPVCRGGKLRMLPSGITFNVDEWPDEVLVPSFEPHIECTKCGHLGASVRPDCTQLRGVPAETRRR
jgi:hypothetical protein